MLNILQDLRFALRQLRKSPGFTLLAALTLAIGIGSATAVFSLVDAVLLKPLPFPQPDRLVALNTLAQPRGSNNANVPATIPNDTSYPNFFDWRDRAKSFTALASWQGNSFTLSSAGEAAQRFDGGTVSSDFFRVLGVTPALGRDFLRSDEQPGNRSVIISHGLWESAFHGSPSAIGQTIQLSDEAYTVVGVLPASFSFPNAPDAQSFITLAHTMEGKNPSGLQRGWNQLDVIGRLAPGVSLTQAAAEMQTIQRALAAQYPDDMKAETAVSVKPELEDLIGDVQKPLRILFSCVCFLLLIACANVAGLLLTRTAGRRGELAIRAALGASRAQIVRQLLLESLLLSSLGGAAGLALAAGAIHLAPAFLPVDLPRLESLALDSRVFFFALAASLLTGLLFGVLPAWRMSRLDPALALRDNTRSNTASKGQQRLHAALVVGETALGLVLLVGAGLLIHSFDKLLTVDPGFNTHHLITFKVGMPPKRFQDEKLTQLSQQLQARFSQLPGVQQSTYAFPIPLTGGGLELTFTIPGRPVSPGEEPAARASVVAANFFQAMQIGLRRGRFFSGADEQPSSAPVLIVNQAFADRFFPGENAVGKRVQTDLSSTDKPESREIVGVIGNVNRDSLTEAPEPEYYVPFAQVPLGEPVFALRVAGDPEKYSNSIRVAAAQIDSTLPVYAMRTNLLTRSTAQQRFQTMLLTAFAGIALLLAAVGLYGVLSYMVTQRTPELGLRMALGAQRSDVLSLVLKRGLVLAAIGLAVGLGASALLTRYLASLLFHTEPLDASTFASTTCLLLAVSALACLAPAYRASRLDPNETLRQQ
jgi:predicted permease